jgi:hypothetical protein
MDRLSREREDERTATSRPPEPVPAPTGPMEWASAMGNQAVARLARQAMEPELEEEAPEAEAEEAPPAEVEQLESQGIGMDALAGLDAVDDLAEGELPD